MAREVPQDGKLPADEGLGARGAIPASVATFKEASLWQARSVGICRKGVFIMDNTQAKRSSFAELFAFKLDTKSLVTIALLVAMEIVLSRFLSINAWNIKIGFNFVPIVIGAMLYGPIAGALIAALGDFLGAILFPIGAYFPGFTLTAFLMGLVFGLFLYRKQSPERIVGAVLINQCLLSQCLNTLWISILYGSPYGPLFVTRLVQTLILVTVQILVVYEIARLMPRFRKMAVSAT